MKTLSSIELAEQMSEAVQQLRLEEKNSPGAGYKALEQFEKELPREMYDTFKMLLDNPNAELKIHIHYHKNN